MSVKWDEKTDYQALINEAVAKKDYKAAAQYEQQRNAKIKHLDATGTNQWNATATNNYAGWLDNTDYSLVGKEQMASGANWEDVLDTYNARYNKAATTEGLKQYANDDVQKEMWDYIVTGMKASQKPSTPTYTVQDNSAYIEQMNKAQREAAIAEIKAAYEKNKAAIDRAGSGVSVGYQNARNEAAGASELAKRNNAQYAAAYGLNTGTGGQMELARNVALQNNLNSINTAEGQSMADLALQRANAETEYNNAIAQANAQGNSELASQLYQEKVRVQETLLNLQIQQAQMEYQAYRDSVADSQWQQSFNQNVGQQNWLNAFNSQQYADQLAQQDWQNYFNTTQYLNSLGQQSHNNLFNQTQYNDSQTAQKQSDLANAGWSFLKVGALPSSEMLAAMGMTAADAQAYIAAAKAASKTTTNKSTGNTQEGYEPKMTYNQVTEAIENGQTTPEVLKAYEYYNGVSYDEFSKTPEQKEQERLAETIPENIRTMLMNNFPGGAITGYQRWQSWVNKYGEDALKAAGFRYGGDVGTREDSTSIRNNAKSLWTDTKDGKVVADYLNARVAAGQITAQEAEDIADDILAGG